MVSLADNSLETGRAGRGQLRVLRLVGLAFHGLATPLDGRRLRGRTPLVPEPLVVVSPIALGHLDVSEPGIAGFLQVQRLFCSVGERRARRRARYRGAACPGSGVAGWHLLLHVSDDELRHRSLSTPGAPADSFLHFAAFVSMFPQLVAGPIVRYTDVDEQLCQLPVSPDWHQFARGLFFFAAGLGQKLLLADPIAARINPLFSDYEVLRGCGSWYAMLGYSCQLYFDFAGYSSMAVGLGLLLGLQFPQNFDSPYKSADISQFWRRWHMTLSSWLRDYLFLPLGGSRYGSWCTLRNLLLVMLLGGLWHGAGWTFVLWGLYHGVLLCLYRLKRDLPLPRLPSQFAVAPTFLAVVFGWVLFRSTDLVMSRHLFAAMFGWHGWEPDLLKACGGPQALAMLVVWLAIVFAVPNVWQVRFRPTRRWAVAVAALLVVCVLRFDVESPFLYFQF